MNDEYGDRLRLVFGGAGVIIVGYGLQLGISFATKLAVARFAGREVYGAVITGMAFLTIIGAIATLGIDTGLSRYLPRFEDQENRRKFVVTSFALVIPVAGLAGLCVYIAAGLIAEHLFNSQIMVGVLQAFGIAIPASVLLKLTVSVIRGEQRSLPRVLLENILFPASRGIGVVIALLLGMGATGVAWGYSSAYILTGLACLVYLAYRSPFEFSRPDRSAAQELVWFSTPLLFSTLMNIVFSDIDTLLIGYLQQVGDVGVYNAAYALATLLTVALNGAGYLLMPVLSEQDATGDSEGIIYLSRTVTRWLIIVTVPLVALYLLIPATIISLSFGEPYLGARSALTMLSIGFFIHVSAGPAGNILISTGESSYILWATTVAAITNVLLNLLLIPRIGILGAAVATTVSYVVLNGIYVGKVYDITGTLPFDLDTLILICVAGLLTMVGNILLPNGGLARFLVLAALATGYVFATYCLVELSEIERELLSEIRERLWIVRD